MYGEIPRYRGSIIQTSTCSILLTHMPSKSQYTTVQLALKHSPLPDLDPAFKLMSDEIPLAVFRCREEVSRPHYED